MKSASCARVGPRHVRPLGRVLPWAELVAGRLLRYVWHDIVRASQILIGLIIFAIFCSLLYLYLSWAVEDDDEDIIATVSKGAGASADSAPEDG